MALKIFEILPDFEAPGVCSVPDPDRFVTEVIENLKDLPEKAELGSLQLLDSERTGADFFKLGSKVLIFSRKVYLSELGPPLEYSGHIHPMKLTDTGEEIYLLNVTARYNCLDLENSLFIKTKYEAERGVDHNFGIREPHFFPKLIGDFSIFRIPQMGFRIYTRTLGYADDPDDFYSIYKRLNVEGLKFKEVWNE